MQRHYQRQYSDYLSQRPNAHSGGNHVARNDMYHYRPSQAYYHDDTAQTKNYKYYVRGDDIREQYGITDHFIRTHHNLAYLMLNKENNSTTTVERGDDHFDQHQQRDDEESSSPLAVRAKHKQYVEDKYHQYISLSVARYRDLQLEAFRERRQLIAENWAGDSVPRKREKGRGEGSSSVDATSRHKQHENEDELELRRRVKEDHEKHLLNADGVYVGLNDFPAKQEMMRAFRKQTTSA